MLERRSVWCRWDLHVHTPGTAMEDRFGAWDEYLAAVEASRDVCALGVTDYLLLDNYEKVRALREGGRLKNIAFILPNIEFRLAPPTDKDTPVNIHLLVSPDDPNHVAEINNALARLHWHYNSRLYSCTPPQLMALGRAVDHTLTDNTAALKKGLDERDTRPLIVDQPDENLDNESIFALLTAYFRSAKKRRQIILITHNPNLVVNGDSEQVIIASADIQESGLPRISYSSNALKHTSPDGTGIRERTYRTLEGGTDAFVRRERRYAIGAQL
ncbi:hypothetical protein EOD23_05965 [Mesorhizobium sp. USDA-HM6]|nr:hypothetical protein EOD23_05965 [Mesorhizobium sp. USDA-HM6]